ncbi:phospholipase D-like domain-containing protein [Desertivirga arenae]|uniref:phospholipase D-like domain-containing protein n=1 Tax=Desertivirga arenae TaxID=2810309 RepID=UPI001A978292|nr:phospholipase D-like domain-containing protein [Pedobacter sp. SYSU D00823]
MEREIVVFKATKLGLLGKLKIMCDVSIHFSNLKATLIRELKLAKNSIKIAVGYLDFELFEKTFQEINQEKVSIDIVVDNNATSTGNKEVLDRLKAIGVKIKIQEMLANDKGDVYGKMHHKFCIIDEATVITGSYNWTFTASTVSFENFIILRNNREAITKFTNEFHLIKAITQERLKNIQEPEKCKEEGCNGILLNMLVLLPKFTRDGNLDARIVQFCTSNYEDHYSEKNAIAVPVLGEVQEKLENQYHQLVESQISSDNLDLTNDSYALLVEKAYSRYSNTFLVDILKSEQVHCWGHLSPSIYGDDDPDYSISISWKDRFVEDQIDDSYATCFDLV